MEYWNAKYFDSCFYSKSTTLVLFGNLSAEEDFFQIAVLMAASNSYIECNEACSQEFAKEG